MKRLLLVNKWFQFIFQETKSLLLSLLLCEFVGDGVFDGGARSLVDDGVPERYLQEERYHHHQVCRVTQSHRHAPIILR